MRKKAKALTIGVLTAAATIAGTTSAFAVPTYYTNNDCGISENYYFMRAATCPDGLLLFYHANGSGATADIAGNISNLSAEPTYAYEGSTVVLQYYTDYEFWPQTGAPNNDGEFQGTRNAVASACNASRSHSYSLYVYPNYSGHSQTIGANSCANLNAYLVNNEASMSES